MFPTNRLLLKKIYIFQKEPVSFTRPRYVPWGSEYDYGVFIFQQAYYTGNALFSGGVDTQEKPE